MNLPSSTHYDKLIARAQTLSAAPCAIAHPCDEPSLSAALEARDLGLLHPILVGPERKIRDTAAQFRLNLGDARIVDAPHSHAAAETAVALVRAGEASLLMKGSLHTDELMHEVVARNTGLRSAAASAMCSSWKCPPTRNRCSSPTRRSTSSPTWKPRPTSSAT